ncbi:NTP/NDP exchange transporter [Candidatus Dependentiae bacterium]
MAKYGMLILEVLAGVASLFMLAATGMLGEFLRKLLSGVTHTLWGDVSAEELRKFGILGISFFIIIGVYWMLRTIKDGFFNTLVGIEYVPRAKMLTFIMLPAIIALYGKLSDWFEKTKLFWVFCGFFTVLYTLIGYSYSMITPETTMVLRNTLGWVSYVSIEFFGSLIIAALFWAFVSSITKTESAKKGYPIVFLAGQIGNFLGASLVAEAATFLGFSNLFYIAAISIVLIPIIIQYLMKTTPSGLLVCNETKMDEDGKPVVEKPKKKTGALEGLRLIASHPFLMGVAVVATVYEVVGAIVDFQFKTMTAKVYVAEAMASYVARVSQMQSFVAITFVLLGTSFFLRRFGVRLCLFGYPATVGLTILAIWLHPQLTVFAIAMIAIKAFSYVLNNPVKEILYIPTSRDVKFKAKGFIDAFGGRTAKAVGSGINEALKANMGTLLTMGGVISLGIVGGWLIVAFVLGKAYDKLIKSGKIIS